MVYAFNPREGEAGKSELEDSLVYRVEFQNSQGYTQKLCLGGVEESKASLSGEKVWTISPFSPQC